MDNLMYAGAFYAIVTMVCQFIQKTKVNVVQNSVNALKNYEVAARGRHTVPKSDSATITGAAQRLYPNSGMIMRDKTKES